MAYAYHRRQSWPVAGWEMILVGLLFFYLLGLDIHGLLSYNNLRRELKALQRASVVLQRSNNRRALYLKARSNAQLEDAWIRQELGYVKPGEIAVVFLKGTHELRDR